MTFAAVFLTRESLPSKFCCVPLHNRERPVCGSPSRKAQRPTPLDTASPLDTVEFQDRCADSGMMPPMKCWELIADKLNANGLVVGLSQGGYYGRRLHRRV